MDVNATAGVAGLANALQTQKFGAQLVTATLDRLNTDPASGRINPDYDFQTKVLGAAFAGKGTAVDMMV